MTDDQKKAHVKSSIKYNDANVRQIKIGLNLRTDADIIEFLASSGNIQGTIKRLIREQIKRRS